MPYSTPSTGSRTAARANLFDIFSGHCKYPSRSPVEAQDQLSDIDSEEEPPSTPPRPLVVVDTGGHTSSLHLQSSSPVNQTPKACAGPSPLVQNDGKPLKSSFKRRLSFPPAFPPSLLERPGVHRRASDPSPPPFEQARPKAVHFASSKLETVCFFRETATPSALLASPPPSRYIIDTAESDPISHPTYPQSQEVILEEVHMDSEELTMKGSILVRNHAYEKAVAALFTMDDWQTRSEVVAHYSASSSSPLPHSMSSVEGEWDRFEFSIHLDHQVSTLAERTMYLAARFVAAGGEWWDNNGGRNYCIRFSRVNDLEATLDSARRGTTKKPSCGRATDSEPPALQVKWTPYTASVVPSLSYSSDDDDGDDSESSPVTPEPVWHETRHPRQSRDAEKSLSPLESPSGMFVDQQ